MLLALIWAGIISFGIIMYVLLDGFDLGIGILFPFIKDHAQHDVMMNTVAPVWDGNETWLVLGGAALYAAFPIAYSVLLPTLYMPIMMMLAALIFRGVAFEFRFKAERARWLWDTAFVVGSTVAAFAQGVILGTFVKGYGTTLPAAFSAYQWLTPFSVMTGIAVVVGYALLGATWLIMKTDGDLQHKMFKAAKVLLIAMGIFLALVSLWTPIMLPIVMERWFTWPHFLYLAPLPILTGIAGLYALYALYERYEVMPFVLAICLFILAYIGFCISEWPYIIPHSVTFWEAAAPASSLKFTLVGVVILLPVLLAYTFYSYRVFSGKVRVEDQHYH